MLSCAFLGQPEEVHELELDAASSRAAGAARRDGRTARGADEAAALSRRARRRGRLLATRGDLWKAPAAGGSAVAPDGASRARAVREVLARRQVDRVHRPVRRRRAGLRDPGRRRRAAASSPTTRRAGRFAPRWGYDNQVYGWTPDGKSVLFRSLRDADGVRSETRALHGDADGGLPGALPMPHVGRGRLLARRQARRLLAAVPRLPHLEALPGRLGAGPLRLRPRDRRRSTPVAPSKRTERDPMWIGDRIYFVSDRDGTLNLYSSDPTGERRRSSSRASTTWDVRWASSDNQGRIVYELGGELRVFDVASKQDAAVADHACPTTACRRGPSRVSAEKQIEDFELSPEGRARAVRRARRRLHGADREGPDPQPDEHARTPTSGTRAGRPTASRSRSSPTAPARSRSTSSTRTASASPSSSPRSSRRSC